MPPPWDSFSAYVASVRRERGYSLRELAKRTGLNPSTIKRTEDTPSRVPNPDVFLALVDALGLNLATATELLEPYQKLRDRFTTDPTGNDRKTP
jgi:transcriptional regulator with XRE-family HTH domain